MHAHVNAAGDQHQPHGVVDAPKLQVRRRRRAAPDLAVVGTLKSNTSLRMLPEDWWSVGVAAKNRIKRTICGVAKCRLLYWRGDLASRE